MAKPMLVTLPCVLLLLDYWPLGRLGKNPKEFWERLPKLAAEKLPLFIPVVSGQCAGNSSTDSDGIDLVLAGPSHWGLGWPTQCWPMGFI